MLATILVVVSAILLVASFFLLPGSSDTDQRTCIWGLYIAHRGLHKKDGSVPENSIAAFTAAIDKGYAIELDIRLTQDEQVVVFHDNCLERMCGVKGLVAEKTYEELRELTLLDSDQHIPLLMEVLDLVDEKVPLLVEFKTSDKYVTLCNRAWKILRQYDGEMAVQSFDPRILRMFKKKVPGILRGQLSAHPNKLPKDIAGFAVGHLLTNCLARPHFVAYQAGPKPFVVTLVEKFCMRVVWTIRSDENLLLLEDCNDAIIFEYFEPDFFYKGHPDHLLPEEADYTF